MPRNPNNPHGPNLPLLERIDAKTNKGGPDDCWLWSGACGQGGHPVSSVKQKTVIPRRVIWELAHGEFLPKTRRVGTTCKNPRCLNPAHLYISGYRHENEVRFQSRTKRVDGDGCWEWTGYFFKSGYAAFSMFVDGVKKQRLASRVAWEMAYGPIVGHVAGDSEKEIVVMHKCDNPRCVRPDHLQLGTDADNIADMIAKGRNSRGPRHGAICKAAKAQPPTPSATGGGT
jgi:hypothetical protein